MNFLRAICFLKRLRPRFLSPAISLDFVGADYAVNGEAEDIASRLTVVRSTAATYWSAEGVLIEAPANQLRLDFDPKTGEPLGLLLENENENVFPWTDDPSQWERDDGVSVVTDDIRMRGLLMARIFPASGRQTKGIENGVNIKGDLLSLTTYHMKFIARGGGGISRIRVRRSSVENEPLFGAVINLDTATVEAGSDLSAKCRDIGDGLVEITFEFASLSTAEKGYIVKADHVENVVASAYFSLSTPQITRFPSSYILTNGTPMARADDQVFLDFADARNAQSGTIVAELRGNILNGVIAEISDGTDINSIRLRDPADPELQVEAGGETQAFLSANQNHVLGDTIRVAAGWSAQSFSISSNQSITATQQQWQASAGTVPDVTILSIGSGVANARPINGHLRVFEYYPDKLKDTQITYLSSLNR